MRRNNAGSRIFGGTTRPRPGNMKPEFGPDHLTTQDAELRDGIAAERYRALGARSATKSVFAAATDSPTKGSKHTANAMLQHVTQLEFSAFWRENRL